jgi:hypothetical protein
LKLLPSLARNYFFIVNCGMITILIRAYSKSRIFARPKNLNKIGPQNQLFDASADFGPI